MTRSDGVYAGNVMYDKTVRRLQIYIQPELDDALAVLAVRQRTSKAALIRQFVAERLGHSPAAEDPLDAVVGCVDDEPGPIDKLVYEK